MIAQIETTNFCNQSCWFCQNAHYPRPRKRIMTMPVFRMILEQISKTFSKKQLNRISFASYNEPTLDPLFRQRLRLLSLMGFGYWFITNGSGLHPSLIDFLVSEQIVLTDFHINLPAIDPRQFQETTGSQENQVDQIRKNLTCLFEKQDRLGAPITIVVHGDGGASHQKNFEQIREFARGYPVTVSFQGVMNRAGMLATVTGQTIDHGTDQVWCTARYFENLYIGVTANLYLCCHDYNQTSTYGNMTKVNLKDLMASKKRSKAVRQFASHFCRHCPYAIKIRDLDIKKLLQKIKLPR